MAQFLKPVWAAFLLCLFALSARSEPTDPEILADMIVPPMALGPAVNDKGVYQLLNSGGAHAGYVFETEPMAPLPGFSGAPINVLVTLDLEGQFLDARLISHNEPIFVSGLGEAPFHKFFEQYRGHSISDTLVVGTPYGAGGDGSALVYLDGVTKATASVRIAHESILAAALQVAREKMGGVSTGPPAYPDRDYSENLDWDQLLAQGLIGRLTVTNAQIDAEFAGTRWADDDPEASEDPEGIYLDLWVIDLGPPAIARSVLSEDTYDDLQSFLEISDFDEPVLLIDTGRHGLLSEEFVRNTAPDQIGAEQGGFPVAMRDADLFIELSEDAPDALVDAVDYGQAIILRTDRRLGFDPSQDWTIKIKAIREHGVFQPEIGSVSLDLMHRTDARFFVKPEVVTPAPPWLEALRGRSADLIVLALGLAALLLAFGPGLRGLADHRHYKPIRLAILAVMTGFVGWWGQGQLSIVTPLATLRTAIEGGSYAFLLYDPFSLLVWAIAIIGFFIWGRALFCGWLCPFGALQEFANWIGQKLRLPQVELPEAWDRGLKWIKYGVLAWLVSLVFLAPGSIDKAAEIEPFKTAITTFFIREWYYVAYAAFWLLLSMVLFKGFCRYVCPLGALMAIGGALRGRKWIERREDCGSPCQLCKVRCPYNAISKQGAIQYSECFGCLDCVTIHNDRRQCVPLILADRKARRQPAELQVPAE